jgi:L-ascorbate metabolism protein UlaG (beta-lactamase superfamily)
MKITQIRNATLLLEYGGVKFLIDPMLGEQGSMPGFAGTVNSEIRNPTVPLGVSMDEVIDVDAVVVTHVHTDHWDQAAAENIPADKPVFVQHFADKALVSQAGYVSLEDNRAHNVEGKAFSDVRVLTGNPEFQGVKLRKVPGQHGSDTALQFAYDALLEVCGVVFTHPEEKTLYLAGDTVWNDHVASNISAYRPGVIILNAGDAQVPGLGNIIMNAEEVGQVCVAAPDATIVATHFEAVNHAVAKRDDLRRYVADHNLSDRVLIPNDGQTCEL